MFAGIGIGVCKPLVARLGHRSSRMFLELPVKFAHDRDKTDDIAHTGSEAKLSVEWDPCTVVNLVNR